MYNFLFIIGIILIFLGIIIVLIYSALNLSSSKGNKNNVNTTIKTGGLIMIGPIPIIFGNSSAMINISIILGIILFIIAIIFFFFIRK
ncbi:MAG: DUF131 domain-containing protein [Candidatus Marsarchaeota archaeon]|nr:DUF131 domain-containing protein [Candidatus Marsarchaeota archaeon]MCL5094548.1 DUF131 domain-containing protein [Candidatus Marsarchaeota archaeon]